MNIKFKLTSIIAPSLLLVACAAARVSPATQAVPTKPNLPNPAAVHCEQQGYKVEIHTAADGSQSGFCLFPDGSECDEWAFFRGECSPSGTGGPATDPTEESEPVPTSFPAPFPIDPADYQGWWTYTHSEYGFSIMLPEDWRVEEVTGSDPLLNGHLLTLHPFYASSESIRMTFRRTGEDARLWPTGVGQGEFIEQGTLDVAGQPAQRVLLVCPDGKLTAIWYHQAQGVSNILRGNLEFGFIFSAGGHCEPDRSLGGKVQRVGEMIIASLKVP